MHVKIGAKCILVLILPQAQVSVKIYLFPIYHDIGLSMLKIKKLLSFET